MRFWLDGRQRTVLAFIGSAPDFDAAAIAAALDDMRDNKRIETAYKDADLSKPTELKSLAAWQKWFEKWENYMAQLCSTASQLIPIAYVYRDHEVIMPEIPAETYSMKQEKLYYHVTELSGSHYVLDNANECHELKALVADGPGWSHIKRFERTKNGCAALLL
jgi:hypothetical protein